MKRAPNRVYVCEVCLFGSREPRDHSYQYSRPGGIPGFHQHTATMMSPFIRKPNRVARLRRWLASWRPGWSEIVPCKVCGSVEPGHDQCGEGMQLERRRVP